MRSHSLTVAVAVVALGCGRARPADSAGVATAVADDKSVGGELPAPVERSPEFAGQTASARLVAEAVRQLRAMKSTRYRHKARIDEATGTFEYDCSGFVAYALLNAAPKALELVPIGVKGRPRAEDFATYFSSLTTTTEAAAGEPWSRVAKGSDIAQGDIIAWLRPADVDNSNTGHIVIAFDRPTVAPPSSAVSNIGGARELLVRVVDATESPHANDVRGPDTTTGLGSGTIGLVVDGSDAPIGYRWKGGESARAHSTLVAISRLR